MNQGMTLLSAAVSTGLGNLGQTTALLPVGTSAVTANPCFGVPVFWAPFANVEHNDLASCMRTLADDCGLSALPKAQRTAFLFAAAKGCGTGLDQLANSNTNCNTVSPLLHEQADVAIQGLQITPSLSLVVSNACASGAIALDIASDLLKSNRCDRVIIAGYDSVSRFVATGFHSLGALSEQPARPFDRNRSGLSLGDAAGLVVLERSAQTSGQSVIIRGTGGSNDANHRTGPSRTGDGLVRAASEALTRAGLRPADIGAIKCHGTATNYNDAMEAKALFALFGNSCPPAVSIKGALGHTSGGGSLVECLIASTWFDTMNIPPTAGFSVLGVDEPVAISNSPQDFSKPFVLCLAAGFGGVNAAVVLEKAGVA